jgi:hypothetical protein
MATSSIYWDQTDPSQSTADVCLREIFLHTSVPMQSAITKLTGYSKRFNANIKICTMTCNNVRQLPKTIFFKRQQEESAASTAQDKSTRLCTLLLLSSIWNILYTTQYCIWCVAVCIFFATQNTLNCTYTHNNTRSILLVYGKGKGGSEGSVIIKWFWYTGYVSNLTMAWTRLYCTAEFQL